jgi:hypothetical protein
MRTVLPPASLKNNSAIALGGAFVLAVLVFLLISMMQRLDKEASVLNYREVVLVQPPAPAVPPDVVKPPPQEKPPKPRFEKQFESINLKQLELSLNPGISNALAVGITSGEFETEIDAIGAIQKMFTFDDLPQAPSIINRPRIQFPQELIQRGVLEGRIVALIEIDEKGRARIIEIISSTHPQLIKTARDVIRQAQFTKPLVGGVARKVRGEWPLFLRAPR